MTETIIKRDGRKAAFEPEKIRKSISRAFHDSDRTPGETDIAQLTDAVTDAEADYLNRYRISRTATTPSMDKAGTYLVGGHAAVIYMRIRKAGGGGDFMRTQRVRTVLSTLADQCREISYEQARDLVDSVMANTTLTNMNLDEMVQAMEYAYSLRGATIEELRIPQDGDATPINYAGMAVQEINWIHSREVMDDYLQNSFLVLDDED